MSILDKLNPITWIKNLLISDFVGGKIRLLLGVSVGVLVSKGYIDKEHADAVASSTAEFVVAGALYFLAWGSSLLNKLPEKK